MKLEVRNLVKQFGDTRALNDLSFNVPEKTRILTIIGPSGSGKSTLLRTLGGLEEIDSGEILFNGEKLPDTPDELRKYRSQNGFLFQQFNLFPHLDAMANITLPLTKVHGFSHAKARELAKETLERFGLGEHAHKLPAQLSGGQQQRAALARAVAHKPTVLFLDEPTSALDPVMSSEVLELIQELAEQGQNIILNTHEMGFAKAVADLVAYLDEGKIHEIAAPKQLFSAPQSSSCRNFLSKVMRY